MHILHYYYDINFQPVEKELCFLEMEALFNEPYEETPKITSHVLSHEQSPYINYRLSILEEAETIEELRSRVIERAYPFEQFKLLYLREKQPKLSYEERIAAVRSIALGMPGEGVVQNPQVILGITCISGVYRFGIYEQNKYSYRKHNTKPYSYCNAVSVDLARSLVNIAIGQYKDRKLFDPCCGIGTVVMEACAMGYTIRGNEYNTYVYEHAKENMLHFNYDPSCLTNADMNTITEHYDVSILDMPYGKMSETTRETQYEILRSAYRQCSKLILLMTELCDAELQELGFTIQHKVHLRKTKNSRMERIIYVCSTL